MQDFCRSGSVGFRGGIGTRLLTSRVAAADGEKKREERFRSKIKGMAQTRRAENPAETGDHHLQVGCSFEDTHPHREDADLHPTCIVRSGLKPFYVLSCSEHDSSTVLSSVSPHKSVELSNCCSQIKSNFVTSKRVKSGDNARPYLLSATRPRAATTLTYFTNSLSSMETSVAQKLFYLWWKRYVNRVLDPTMKQFFLL